MRPLSLMSIGLAMASAMSMPDPAEMAALLRGSRSNPLRSRSPGDRAHKRWKRARASGRR